MLLEIDLKIINTDDKSNTLYSKQFDETYHSVFGAYNETQHIFINAGLAHYINLQTVNVLDVGFGTGLNALATLAYANNYNNCNINYIGVEAMPIDMDIIKQLNYFDFYPDQFKNQFHLMHSPNNRNCLQQISSNFQFTNQITAVQQYQSNIKFDVIYYDAFAPDKQAEMWEQNIFNSLYAQTNYYGCLVTYSAKGAVRRMLKQAGYAVYKLQGPPGKREMTKAIKL